MAKIIVLGLDGLPQKTPDGQDKFIYSVDGRHLVKAGELMEVRKIQNINGVKKHNVVAYRPCTEEDKNKKLAAKKAAMEKLKAEIAETEGAPTETSPLEITDVNAKLSEVNEKQLAELKKQTEKTIATTKDTGEDTGEADFEDALEAEESDVPDTSEGDTDTEPKKPAEGTEKQGKGRTRPPRQPKK